MTDWLLAIDLQPAFAHPDSPWYTASLAATAPAIAELAALFGEQTLFTRFVPPSRPAGSWTHYYDKWHFALDPANAWLWDLDAPWAGRPSIASHTFSKWLPPVRDRLGPEAALVLCGVSTDCCVLMTALAAVDAGVPVRVVADACAAKTPALHARALDLLAGRAPQLAITTVAEERARHRPQGRPQDRP